MESTLIYLQIYKLLAFTLIDKSGVLIFFIMMNNIASYTQSRVVDIQQVKL